MHIVIVLLGNRLFDNTMKLTKRDKRCEVDINVLYFARYLRYPCLILLGFVMRSFS